MALNLRSDRGLCRPIDALDISLSVRHEAALVKWYSHVYQKVCLEDEFVYNASIRHDRLTGLGKVKRPPIDNRVSVFNYTCRSVLRIDFRG